MSTRPTTESHPLVQAYLADLNRALAGSDPRERADVLDGVREHLREALGDDHAHDAARIRQVLVGLGPVEGIAAHAATSPPPQASAALGGDPTSLVALIVAIAAAALIFIPIISIPLAIAALVTSAVHLRSPGANRRRCWAVLGVAVATLVITAGTAASLLMVSTEAVPGSPTPATSLMTE